MGELIDQYVVVTVTTALAFQRDASDLPPDDNVISYQNYILENLNRNEDNSENKNNSNIENSTFLSSQMNSHKLRQKSTEAPKPRHFIHTEYSLLGENSNKSETDIITYGTACKFFRNSSSADKSSGGSSGGGDTRLIKTFDDPLGDKIWCVFKHQHTLRITDDILNNLYKNKIKIKIWDNKDRVMPRARFERPKAMRYFDQVGMILDEVKHQQMLSEQSQENTGDGTTTGFKRRSTTTGRNSKLTNPASNSRNDSIFIPENPREIFPDEAVTIVQDPHDSPFSVPNSKINPAFNPYLNKVCFSSVYEQRVTKSAKKIGTNATNKISKVSLEHGNMVKAHDRASNMHRREFTLPSDNFIKKPSSRPYSASKLPHMTVEIDLSVLFAGFSDVTSRGVPNEHALENGSGVRDCFVTFEINKDLLSQAQQKEFNPLVFRIVKLMNMPTTPYDFHELSRKCRPVHIEYSFLGNKHKTTEKPHAREIVFDDVKVILAGKVDINKIIEELQVKDFEFKIHDRDQIGTAVAGPNAGNSAQEASAVDKYKKPVLFGEESADSEFGQRTIIKDLTNESDLKSALVGIQNCYGYSKLNLKPLLSRTNQKITATIPVLPASVKSSAKIMNGHFLQAGTELQIEIHSAKPLLHDEITPEIQQQARPFQILCLNFTHSPATVEESIDSRSSEAKSMNVALIKRILNYVNSHNLTHFGLEPEKNGKNLAFFANNEENPLDLDGFSILKNRANFLESASTKFEAEKTSDKWFSGYHIDDVENNSLIVLNAHHSEIQKFLLEFNQDFYDNPNCDVLQDSSLNLTKRTFNSSPYFFTLLLNPLAYLLSNPKMYVEKAKELLGAIMSIRNLKNCKTLREALKTDCFTSDRQLALLERKIGRLRDDFGHFMDCEFGEQEMNLDGTPSSGSSAKTSISPTEREALDHQNEAFKNYKKALLESQNDGELIKFRDIVAENRKIIAEMSEVVKEHKISRPLSTFDQYANSAMDDLKHRQHSEISDRMKSLWAPFYEDKNIDDSNLNDLKKSLAIEPSDSQNGFVQQKRFTAYGHKTAQQSNRHDKIKGINHNPQCGFNIAKSLDCNTTWIENRLHNNKLKPTLPERDQRFYKNEPLENLKLHFPKIDVFDKDCPVSIILGGDKQNEEIQKVKMKDLQHWKEKLIADPTWKFHRQNTGTEQKFKLGPEYQLDKLQGILKINTKHQESPNLNYLQKFPAHDMPALPVNTKLIEVDGTHMPNFKGSGVKEMLEAEKRMPFMDF